MKGLICTVTRRYIKLLGEDWNLHDARATSKALDLVVGDRVDYASERGDFLVTERYERRNALFRALGKKTKHFAANVDLLCIISAPPPLFNTTVTDRLLLAASDQEIPTILILNKCDLRGTDFRKYLEIYKKLGIPTYQVSALTGDGIPNISSILHNPEMNTVVLCGVSGVGKSRLLNQLIPDASRDVGTVSKRTGQGRQTTSQARGYLYKEDRSNPLLLVDLPGFQSFSITHIEKRRLASLFPEFSRPETPCAFADCNHLEEPGCMVRVKLEDGEIAISRYESYIRCLEELEAARPY